MAMTFCTVLVLFGVVIGSVVPWNYQQQQQQQQQQHLGNPYYGASWANQQQQQPQQQIPPPSPNFNFNQQQNQPRPNWNYPQGDNRMNAQPQQQQQQHFMRQPPASPPVQERSWLCFAQQGNVPSSYNYQQIYGERFTESDRCNGDYVCSNGRDERNCPEKCISPKYSEEKFKAGCNQRRSRWQFDQKTRRCDFFVFAGCTLQPNMFLTKSECELECLAPLIIKEADDLPPSLLRSSAIIEDKDVITINYDEGDDSDDTTDSSLSALVQSIANVGKYPCNGTNVGSKHKHFYNDTDRCNGIYDCESGVDELNCTSKCYGFRYPEDPELLDCRASIPRYFYDSTTQKCTFFEYGGCAEVINMFRSAEECLRECKGIVVTSPKKMATKTTLLGSNESSTDNGATTATKTPVTVPTLKQP